MNRTYSSRIAQRHSSLSLPAAAILSASLLHAAAFAQVPVDEAGNPLDGEVSVLDDVDVENPGIASETFSPEELENLIGQIALYPDDLLAVVLPASTYPLEIVQAARFLEQAETDSSLEPDEGWDDSVVALLNYPDVLNMMNDDLDWTWQLGEAVASQQSDVILAIESFRDRAYAAGNLKTDEHQVVSLDDEGIIEIEPVAEDVIYVPYYEPERVVYQSPTPVYFYHPRAYPVYHYPYPRNHYLTDRFFWGVTTAFTIGWTSNHLNVYHHSYLGHPFYGRHYNFAGAYWRRPSFNVYNNWYVNRRSPYYQARHRRGDRWRPRYRRHGARPNRAIVQNRYPGEIDRVQRARRIAERERIRTRSGDSINARDRRTDGRSYNAGLRRPAAANPARNADNRRRIRNRSTDAIRFRSRGTDGAYSANRRERVTNARRANDAARINAARDRRTAKRTQAQRKQAQRIENRARAQRAKAQRSEKRTQSRARTRQPSTSIQRRQTADRSNAARQPARVIKPNRQRAAARAPSRPVQRSTNPRAQQSGATTRRAAPRQARPANPRRAQRAAATTARSSAPRRGNNRARKRPNPRR